MPPKAKNQSKSPSKAIAQDSSIGDLRSHLAKKTVDFAKVIAEEVALPAIHALPAPSTKRKADVVVISSEDSADEAGSASVSPKKRVSKRRKTNLPLPGDVHFDALPPVSVARETTPDRTLTVGSVTMYPDSSSIVNTPTSRLSTRRSQRSISKTEKEKAKAMDSSSKPTGNVSPQTLKTRLSTIHVKEEVANVKLFVDDEVAVSLGDSDDNDDHDSLEELDEGNTDSRGDTLAIHWHGEDIETDDVEAKAPNTVDAATSPCPAPGFADDGEPTDDSTVLALLFENVPQLPSHDCDLEPFSSNTEPMSYRASILAVQNKLSEKEIRSIIRCVKFTQAGQYCNMSRIQPELLTKVAYATPFSERIKYAEDRSTVAIRVMPVVVEDCEIVEPGYLGFNDQYRVRRLTGLPFTLIWERDLNMWGSILGFDTIPAPVSPVGISFLSQGEGKGGGKARSNLNPSPSKPKSHAAVAVSRSPVKDKSARPSFKNREFLPFEEITPIYDGRGRNGVPAFDFSAKAFEGLADLPMYTNKHKARADLPTGAVVAVGYTVGTYIGTKKNCRCLSPNLLFVIVLAVPSS